MSLSDVALNALMLRLREFASERNTEYESHLKQVPRVYDLSDMTRRCHDSLEKGQY